MPGNSFDRGDLGNHLKNERLGLEGIWMVQLQNKTILFISAKKLSNFILITNTYIYLFHYSFNIQALLEIEKLEKNREFKFILPKSMTVGKFFI